MSQEVFGRVFVHFAEDLQSDISPFAQCAVLDLEVPIRRSRDARMPSVYLKTIGEFSMPQAISNRSRVCAPERTLSTTSPQVVADAMGFDSVLTAGVDACAHAEFVRQWAQDSALEAGGGDRTSQRQSRRPSSHRTCDQVACCRSRVSSLAGQRVDPFLSKSRSKIPREAVKQIDWNYRVLESDVLSNVDLRWYAPLGNISLCTIHQNVVFHLTLPIHALYEHLGVASMLALTRQDFH